MRKNILVFGSISGLVSLTWVFIMLAFMPDGGCDMENGMVYGYASMLVANIFLFVGVKNYRDKYNGGYISFGKAFKVAFLIALVAATIYVGSWLIYYYSSGTNFLEQYTATVLKQLEESGASAQEIAKQAAEMKEFGEMYQNPFFNAVVTYMEILPVGIICALLTALILRKKAKHQDQALNS